MDSRTSSTEDQRKDHNRNSKERPLADLFLIVGIHPSSIVGNLSTYIYSKNYLYEKLINICPHIYIYIYIYIEGSSREKERNNYKPYIVDSYPLEYEKKEHQYVESLEMICFPRGYNIGHWDSSKVRANNPSKIHNYTVTMYNGDKKYITVLSFDECYTFPNGQRLAVPIAFVLSSPLLIFNLQRYIYIYIYNVGTY